MLPEIVKKSDFNKNETIIYLVSEISDLPIDSFDEKETEYISKRLAEKNQNTIILNKLGHIVVVYKLGTVEETTKDKLIEKYRKSGESLLGLFNDHKIENVCIIDSSHMPVETLAFAEGMVLGNYQFLKYRKDREEKESSLKTVEIVSSDLSDKDISELNILCKAVYTCRSLINEPLSTLNAEKLAQDFEIMAQEAGIKIEVLNKQKIEALKMGGLLAVNFGSIDPPTFSIMEYKPEGAVNDKPIVFIGKGVVYDTGGLSLKPTSSMDTMKCDMSGAAAVASAIYAIALAKLPVYVIALVPATDNRPDGNAYVPGDIITMMDGTTVEVLNTDAEGRLILADALTYAKKYDPLLVIDVATLTGAAEAALGRIGIAGMHNKAENYFPQLVKSSFSVCERIAEFPFWDDYEELLKSEIADLKNIGGKFAGAITAGKFLQHFTDYPWIHLDIAGPAFIDKRDSYRTAGGTGVGVRLLFDFVKGFGG
ncbi:MAG: leucyl aminopeptidase [Bacteroidales bacterium]|nr:leucyl aminopeptidase [Bacteroidales bacterium]